MPEAPRPNPALIAQSTEWAQKIIVEASSVRYKEHIYQGYNTLIDVFLVNRDQILQETDENGGIDRLTGYGNRENGIICKNGHFIRASRLLSVTVLDEPVDLPPGSPHGIQMNQKLTVWFGGGGVVTEPWNIDNLDHGVMHNGGGMSLVFTPGYSPASVGITETLSTTVDTGGDVEEHADFSEHFRIDSDKLHDQRPLTNPTTDADTINNILRERNSVSIHCKQANMIEIIRPFLQAIR